MKETSLCVMQDLYHFFLRKETSLTYTSYNRPIRYETPSTNNFVEIFIHETFLFYFF